MICDAAGNPVEPYEDDLHLMEDSPAERFINLLARQRLCHQHLGLIRRDMLARTALLGDHIACDVNLLAELTLYGKFYECPERMFFRRFHAESSSAKKGPDADAVQHQLDFTDPRRVLGLRYHKWRSHAAFAKAVARAPLSPSDRWRLYVRLFRGVVWERQALAAEIASEFRASRRRRAVAPQRETPPVVLPEGAGPRSPTESRPAHRG
jgi:hypothetical protein